MELGGGAGVLASANCRKARVQLAAQRILASQGWRGGGGRSNDEKTRNSWKKGKWSSL